MIDKPEEQIENFKKNMKYAFTKEHLKEFAKCYGWIPFTWLMFLLVGMYFGNVYTEQACNVYVNEHFNPMYKAGYPMNYSINMGDGMQDGLIKSSVIYSVDKINKVTTNEN